MSINSMDWRNLLWEIKYIRLEENLEAQDMK